MPCDYNGDGKDEFAVWRPSTGVWHIYGSNPIGPFGWAGDVLVPDDYNGDGRCDVAVWRPSTATWWIYGMNGITWGWGEDIPVPRDYNGQ